MKIILTGATGFVGEGVLLECLRDSRVEKILSISRRPCGHQHEKLEEYLVSDLTKLPETDERHCEWLQTVGNRGQGHRCLSKIIKNISMSKPAVPQTASDRSS